MKKSNTDLLDMILTADEAAALLGVTTRQIQRLCKAGRLTSRQAKGSLLILRESVTAYHRERENPST